MVLRKPVSENRRFSQMPSQTPSGTSGKNLALVSSVAGVIRACGANTGQFTSERSMQKNGILIQFTQVKINTLVPTNSSLGRRCGSRNMAPNGPAPWANVEVMPMPMPHGQPTR